MYPLYVHASKIVSYYITKRSPDTLLGELWPAVNHYGLVRLRLRRVQRGERDLERRALLRAGHVRDVRQDGGPLGVGPPRPVAGAGLSQLLPGEERGSEHAKVRGVLHRVRLPGQGLPQKRWKGGRTCII